MIVCGPAGVGKTMAAKQAFDNNETIDGIDTPTTVLPFYVDLKSFVVPASHEQAAVRSRDSKFPPRNGA